MQAGCPYQDCSEFPDSFFRGMSELEKGQVKSSKHLFISRAALFPSYSNQEF